MRSAPDPTDVPAPRLITPRRVAALVRAPSSFAVVGFLGIFVNQAAIYLFTEKLGVLYLVSALIATLFSTSFNFYLIEKWVFRYRAERLSPWPIRFLAFMTLNFGSGVLIRLPVLFAFGPDHYLVGNFVAILVTFGFRYFIADHWIWGGRDRREQAPDASGWYNYDLHGLLGVRSQIALPELAAFGVAGLARPARLTVAVDSPLGGRLRTGCIAWRDGPGLHYREMLGALGAAFDISEREGATVITANWLLAWSNHVLYTNMVEPMLRFLLAAQGYMLLHGASLEMLRSDGSTGGLILSAKTDTGKTSTVLRLLADQRARFLGDDMVILGPDGSMLGFPKPMTLSSHTMAAVPGAEQMSYADRMMLSIRSRLHSREGREVGHFLGRLPLPIVTINAWVQLLIPPPKYHVESLVPCQIVSRAQLSTSVIMERGEPDLERLAEDQAAETLVVNTDDAYTFPPFASIAPLVMVGGLSGPELRERERAILRTAIGGAENLYLRVPGFGWAERLTEVLDLARIEPDGPNL